MTIGLPVDTFKVLAVPEIVSDLAVLIDTRSAPAVHVGICEMLNNASLRLQLTT